MTLKERLSSYEIVLASQSPRRIQFLKDLQLDFRIQPTDVDEIFDQQLKAAEITNYLCQLKANAHVFSSENEVVITCDTIVWHENKALGKPTDYNDAFEIISSLVNKTHEVISSICIKTKQTTKIITDTTHVTFGFISDEDIKHYIETYLPYDKAGAYGIQEWIGLIGITKIEGSYTNVVGMPMEKLYHTLQTL